jgi:hypothetical protein
LSLRCNPREPTREMALIMAAQEASSDGAINYTQRCNLIKPIQYSQKHTRHELYRNQAEAAHNAAPSRSALHLQSDRFVFFLYLNYCISAFKNSHRQFSKTFKPTLARTNTYNRFPLIQRRHPAAAHQKAKYKSTH